jgi:hypothetical protein
MLIPSGTRIWLAAGATDTYLRTGSPSLHQSKVEVIRLADSKLLGESIGYSRGGGDLPGPWQPSSFSCPQEYGDIPLLTKIFSKE